MFGCQGVTWTSVSRQLQEPSEKSSVLPNLLSWIALWSASGLGLVLFNIDYRGSVDDISNEMLSFRQEMNAIQCAEQVF